MLGASHPIIYKLIDSLKKLQEITRAKIEEVVRGGEVGSGRHNYKLAAELLKKVVESYEEHEDKEVYSTAVLVYLRGVAHHVEYNV